jgi:hypothetical protein
MRTPAGTRRYFLLGFSREFQKDLVTEVKQGKRTNKDHRGIPGLRKRELSTTTYA